MWLVLCSAQDWSALWAYDGLKRRGLAPVEVVTPEALAYAPLIEHRISDGRPSTRIRLQDGRIIDSVAVRGALNRLSGIPTEHLRKAQRSDRDYAAQELHSLFLSWLHGLPGQVINRPSPQGLSGAERHLSEWIWLAGQAGLPALPYHQDAAGLPPTFASPGAARSRWVLLDGVPYGPPHGPGLPEELGEGCANLARLSGTRLLDVEFARSADAWLFAGAQPAPDLCLGGEPLLDALAGALRS
jgi:hypothetical protein